MFRSPPGRDPNITASLDQRDEVICPHPPCRPIQKPVAHQATDIQDEKSRIPQIPRTAASPERRPVSLMESLGPPPRFPARG